MKKIKIKKIRKKLKKLRKIKVEIFKPIYIENEKSQYYISNYGRVYNSKTKNFRKGVKDKKGYLRIQLNFKGKMYPRKIHRLVAQAFIPQIDKTKNQVNHKNGKKKDNRKKNLEWCNNSENQIHAYKYGLSIAKKEEKHWNCKTSKNQVKKICELISSNKYTMVDIANMTNSTTNIVYDINFLHVNTFPINKNKF